MKKFFLVSLLSVSMAGILPAQTGELIIKNSSRGYYLDHQVSAKENFYSIGRLYHTHPRNIASFNGLDMSRGLSIGQSLQIPLADTNFSQSVNTGVPVYYIVGDKEGLMTVSNKNRNVSLSDLRHWNGLVSDVLPAGKKLIVGFLITDEMPDRVVTIPAKKTEVVSPPAEEKKQETTEVKKPESEKEKIIPAVVKESTEKKEEKTVPASAGYFQPHFEYQVKQYPVSKELTVTSGIFKTLSGWEDAKFYLLIDKVEPGTIVRITNPANNKTVYAKVLYGMENIRQNQGLDIRISNATASALEITEQDKFIVKVNY